MMWIQYFSRKKNNAKNTDKSYTVQNTFLQHTDSQDISEEPSFGCTVVRYQQEVNRHDKGDRWDKLQSPGSPGSPGLVLFRLSSRHRLLTTHLRHQARHLSVAEPCSPLVSRGLDVKGPLLSLSVRQIPVPNLQLQSSDLSPFICNPLIYSPCAQVWTVMDHLSVLLTFMVHSRFCRFIRATVITL